MTRPVKRAVFRIPEDLRPGLYLMLIYDGSEGGQHYTWDYFHVLGRQQALSSLEREGDGSDVVAIVAALVGAGVGALGLLAAWFYRRRGRRTPAG